MIRKVVVSCGEGHTGKDWQLTSFWSGPFGHSHLAGEAFSACDWACGALAPIQCLGIFWYLYHSSIALQEHSLLFIYHRIQEVSLTMSPVSLSGTNTVNFLGTSYLPLLSLLVSKIQTRRTPLSSLLVIPIGCISQEDDGLR